MGIFTTALRNKKNTSNSQKKYLTSLPQHIACYLAAYFDEKSPFERVVHFEVSNVHKKSLDFFASRTRRSEMECSALGFSYHRRPKLTSREKANEEFMNASRVV